MRREVAPWFRLATNRALAPDVEKLAAEARQAAESIADRIGDAAIARPALLQKLNETLAKHSLVTIRGLPGSENRFCCVMRSTMRCQMARDPTEGRPANGK